MADNTPSTFAVLFITSAILFGGLVISSKLTQKVLDARFQAAAEQWVLPS